MEHHTRKKRISLIVKVSVVLLLLWVGLQFLFPILTSEDTRIYIESLGALGPLAVISYSILAQVFAPLSGTPGTVVSLALFGIYNTMGYIYIAQIIGGTINFWISKKFGRALTIRLVGKKFMQDVDSFVKAEGTGMLIIARMFGFPIFDVISYATGLTEMKYKKYIMITATFSIVPMLAIIFFFRDIDFTTGRGVLTWIGVLTTVAIIFVFFLRRFMIRRGRKRELNI